MKKPKSKNDCSFCIPDSLTKTRKCLLAKFTSDDHAYCLDEDYCPLWKG